MLFLPAHYTTMSVEPGDLTLKAGEDLKLAVTLDGRPVKSAQLVAPKEERRRLDLGSRLPRNPSPGEPAQPLVGL